MSAKEITDVILKMLEIVVSWPVAVVLILVWFRGELGSMLPDLVKRVSKAPGGWEFQALQAEVASLVNQTEIENDQATGDEIKVDPKTIRLKYSSNRQDAKYWAVNVWLDAPVEFLPQVEKVIYERHPTFKNRYMEATTAPFEDSFKCWGEFTIRAEIKTKSGRVFKRQRYLSLEADQYQVDA